MPFRAAGAKLRLDVMTSFGPQHDTPYRSLRVAAANPREYVQARAPILAAVAA